MEKGTVKRRILISNIYMVLITLMIFLGINILIIYCYTESIEHEVKDTIEKIVEPNELENLLKMYTIHRNEFILLFVADGILCIAGLLIISQFFTKSLTAHIMEPLVALAKGTQRIKANNLEEEIFYDGDKEFEEVCDSFNDMMREILTEQEKNRKYEKARTDMIAGISHDLRTPLTAIKGTIKALMDGIAATPEAQKMFLETAYRRTGEMDMLLNQLFYLSKIETGNMPVHLQNVDIADFLKTYVQAKKDYAKDTFERIHVNIEESPCVVSLDPEQFQRILDNLLENSRKYAETDSLEIDIKLSRLPKGCGICVKDNGKGVPEEKLPYVFDEFFRADESRNKKEGSGLGLFIVKNLMEQMGGSVSAANEEGFAVYLRFPQADRKEEEHGRE